MASSATRMLMAAGGNSVTPPPFTVSAASNGNAVNISSTGGTTPSNSSTGSVSVWVNFVNVAFTNRTIISTYNGAEGFKMDFVNSTTLQFEVTDSTNSNAYVGQATVPTMSSNVWYNILLSWDTSTSTAVVQLYLNGAAQTVSMVGGTSTAFLVYNGNPLVLYADTTAGSRRINGCLSEIWYAPTQYIDFSNSTNRAKFYNSGVPVDLGASGQTPTGTSPSWYWRGIYNNLNNLGSAGGTFTQNGGSLTNCGSAP